MMQEPAWPLYPPPGDFDSLRQYVEQLARAYGVTFENFCFNALGISHEDEQARHLMKPTKDVLERLSVGLGMPIGDLRMFPERRRKNLARLNAEFDEWLATPEGKQKFESMWPSKASHLGTPAGDMQM